MKCYKKTRSKKVSILSLVKILLVYATKIQIFLTITKIAIEKFHICQLMVLILTNLYLLLIFLFDVMKQIRLCKSKLHQTKKSKFTLAFFVTIPFELIIPP
ncbi:MAG TPA: hypothetical protein DER08_09400 [Flavobacterium sp.]|nr:MAG: hypothetical protein A2X21_07890 [Flavobacteria bacterium GWA2_35_26]HCF04548.1 hypothetical protein [Flavobacterium sp.]